MLENRAFDHLLGYAAAPGNGIAGLSGGEFNLSDPGNPASTRVSVGPATGFAMPYDPGHEFADVQVQLFGAGQPVVSPAPMSGFLYNTMNAPGPAVSPALGARLMECFTVDQVPVMAALAAKYSVFNSWFSSLPGPTWPNRFFVHAATSGGLTNSPTDSEVVGGYSFDGGTIYDALDAKKIGWRIYHDGLPQTAGIQSLRGEFLDPFTENFRDMSNFGADVSGGSLPPYVFIEPNYDTGGNYVGGNSMHPLNDIRKGEALLKSVYETIRGSGYWTKTMLVITFDEHGGFFDHVSPPGAVPTGDDYRYATPGVNFSFNRLGVRVPGIVVSAFTKAGTVVGTAAPGDPAVFDHASVLATAELRFALGPLTARDASAMTLDAALNLAAARTDPVEAPIILPSPAAGITPGTVTAAPLPAPPGAPLSANQKSFVALATACSLHMAPVQSHPAIWAQHMQVKTQRDAALYIADVETKIAARRAATASAKAPDPSA